MPSRATAARARRARRWCESSAICTFSRTVMEPKVAVIWKVRPTPSRQIARGARPVMSPSEQPTRPASGRSWPFSMLKQVDLPAPFGPISASISPGCDGEGDAVDGAGRRRTLFARPRPRARRSWRSAPAAGSARAAPARPCGKTSTSSDDRAPSTQPPVVR